MLFTVHIGIKYGLIFKRAVSFGSSPHKDRQKNQNLKFMMLLFIHCFSIFPSCIFEVNTVKTSNFGLFWLSLITTSLYTWQRSLCDRNRLNEPAKAFMYRSGERIVCDFSCALGISSPVGISLSKCSGIRLSVQHRAFLEKENFLVQVVQRK